MITMEMGDKDRPQSSPTQAGLGQLELSPLAAVEDKHLPLPQQDRGGKHPVESWDRSA